MVGEKRRKVEVEVGLRGAAKAVAGLGVGLSALAFILPWVSLPFVGEVSFLQMLTLAREVGGRQVTILEMLARDVPLVWTTLFMYSAGIVLGSLSAWGLSERFKKYEPAVTRLAGILVVGAGLIWVYAFQLTTPVTLLGPIFKVGIGAYISIVGGLLMSISPYLTSAAALRL
jgi:hypothetical protein